MIIAKAPGKLFIAGEYAITEVGNTAILVAVDRFITVYIKEAKAVGSINIHNEEAIEWTRVHGELILERFDPRLRYILAAIGVIEKYAKELGKNLTYYHIKVESELEAPDGRKYGLGSSAAVVVATIEALCRFYDIKITNKYLFKLAAFANLLINEQGSCGDIAACVYGGWTVFQSFDKEFVLEKQEGLTVSHILDMKWPALKIERLSPPRNLRLIVGWTGKTSTTSRLLNKIGEKRVCNKSIYKDFLADSKECMAQIVEAFKDDNIEKIQIQLMKNRKLLANLGSDLGIEIETYELKRLCNIAQRYGAGAKLSGAGGGDCGIAIMKDDAKLKPLIKQWKSAGITYLPLKVYNRRGEYIDK